MQAGLAELLYTFMLCFVVLNVAASNKHGGKNQFYGLAIGFVIVAGAYSGGSVSMGCFNPAVAFGIDVSSAYYGVKYCFIYTAFEFVGAALAAGAFFVCRPEELDADATDKPEEYPMSAKLVSEGIGTFVLVLTVMLNVLGSSPAGAFSIAASLMCMIYALGNCSGAHFNPAVTLAILLAGRDKVTKQDAGSYVASQLLGGVLAAFVASGMRHGETTPLGPKDPYGWGAALMGEAIFTFVLCFVVLCVATTRTPMKHLFGLAIGSCVTAGGLAIGNISGGSLNPAVSVGISSSRLISGGLFYNCLLYSCAECLGAVAAAGVFQITHSAEYSKGLLPVSGVRYV